MLGQPGQANCIGLPSKAGAQDAVVAGELTLRTEPPFYTEQHGIQREERQANLLQQIRPIVATAEMFHLVQDYLLQLQRREFLKERGRDEDAGAEEAEYAGPFDFNRGAKLCRPAAILIAVPALQQGLDRWVRRDRSGPASQPVQTIGADYQLRASPKGEHRPQSGDGQAPARIEINR